MKVVGGKRGKQTMCKGSEDEMEGDKGGGK